MQNPAVEKNDIIARLRACEADLRARGVVHAALFGSRARGDNFGPVAVAGLALDLDLDAVDDVYAYVGLKHFIAGLFDGPVDVIDREGLKPYIRPPAESEAVYAF